MSTLAVEGFRAERTAILEVLGSLTPEEWNLPSACAGWTVRDLVGHLGCTLHGVVDPAFLPDFSAGAEEGMEPPVALRREWTIAEVVAEYETYSAQAADTFAMFQDEPMASVELPMGQLGTHPMSMLASTFLFDSYCHLRHDLLAPGGPLDRPEPDRDEARLAPTVEWMLAGLPWMCAEDLAALDRPVALVLDGPGGGHWTIAPSGPDGRVTVSEGAAADVAATVTSDTHAFVSWGTRRSAWRDHVTVTGDDATAASFLDAINII